MLRVLFSISPVQDHNSNAVQRQQVKAKSNI